VFEAVMTSVFVTAILGATAAGFAGLAIGLKLTAIHHVGINLTGV
jgi:aquaporin Z